MSGHWRSDRSLALSKLVTLPVIFSLTFLQSFRFVPASLTSTFGRYVMGATAGIVTGLVSVSGKVVALYVLESRASATTTTTHNTFPSG
tara:strand:- start:2390 stop:2656 length:267 start_codon:yes stop_codon:yes gene_type:complete